MDKLEIAIDQNKSNFSPGDTISGSIYWQCPDVPRKIELRLFWYTRGKGNEDGGLVDSLTIDQPQNRSQKMFSFKLPIGPYSFSGKLISIIWALELDSGKDTVIKEFSMGPDAKPITIQN